MRTRAAAAVLYGAAGEVLHSQTIRAGSPLYQIVFRQLVADVPYRLVMVRLSFPLKCR